MPTFVSPLVITDGTTSETFTAKPTITVGSSVVTEYLDITAIPAKKSSVKTKYDAKNGTKRSVTQRNEALLKADAVTRQLATINLSAVYNEEHSVADLTRMGKQLGNAMTKTDFWVNFFNQM